MLTGCRKGEVLTLRWSDYREGHLFLRGSKTGPRTVCLSQAACHVLERIPRTSAWAFGFSTAAWKLAPRDKFIGWTPPRREKNLPLVVDNPRFLILPWINIPNLGSHILAIVRPRLPQDWAERYHTTPVLIETFVETPRYTGAVYRASGWIRVGTTHPLFG